MSQKPISTYVSDFCLFIVRLFLFVLLGNPLSMFFLQLFFPHDAADFANNRNIFGEKIYAFYERFALKWPFYWAKWWMKLENLSNYTAKQQIKYLFKVAFRNQTEVDALKAMPRNSDGVKEFWPAAYEELFFKYGNKKLPYPAECHWKEVGGCSVGGYVKITVADFMMRHIRLSYTALEAAIKKATHSDFARDELKKYLATGALNDSQLDLLIDAVANDSGSGDFQMLGVLMEYVKRYNLRKEHWQRIKKQFPQPFIELLEEAAHAIEQVKVVRSLKNTSEGRSAWCKFCRETEEILPTAQGKMALWQYDIFHDTGHKLNSDAILALLRRSDEKMWRLIFEREEIDDNVQLEIGSHVMWWPVYQEVIKNKR